MTGVTDQIKEKLDVVEFLKGYMQLLPAGKNFRGLCPFHKESNPSLIVSPDRQSWYCFGGCNDGGDIFKFLMKYENIEFYEALKILAEKAGITLKSHTGAASEYKQYGVLYEINEAAKDYFKKGIASPSARNDARQYLLNRGLKDETIEEFEVGFAADNNDDLMQHLLKSSFNVQDIERAGLISKTARGNYWDRFRGRIMFPLYNSFGKVVGFTGREIPGQARNDNMAKYINSPETPVFNKSRLLYGLHKAKPYIRKTGWVLLVEGQMDFLMSYQDGVKNVVASSGTALTNEHLKTLRRMADKIMLSFDKDEAGQLAAERSIDLATANDFTVKILNAFEDKDPAELVRQKPGILKEIIKKAQPAISFYLSRYINGSADKQKVRVVLSKASNIFSSIERANWIKELSVRTGIREEALFEELKKLPKEFSGTARNYVPEEKQGNHLPEWSRKEILAARVLDLGGRLPGDSNWRPSPELAMKASLMNGDLESPQDTAFALSRQLKIDFLKNKKEKLRQIINLAEQNQDENKLAETLKEFDIITKELHNISNEGKGLQKEKTSPKNEKNN